MTFEQVLGSGRSPAWLPQVLGVLHDGQDPETAARWERRVVGCWSAVLPFTVVHDWQARTVVPMMVAAEPAGTAAEEPAGGPTATAEQPAVELQRMHARAAAGDRFEEAGWRAVLEPVLYQLYRDAYGYADAYATAHASASAYASANNFSPDGAVRFAESYAADSTEANRQSYAESNAVATAALLAAAYATHDHQAYADAYPFALLHACAHASANRARPAADEADRAARRQATYAHLADGLADSFARMG